MKLYEYKAKEIFSNYGIPVSRGILVKDPNELKEFKFPAVLKSQVLVGGRGKAGGIKFADDLDEARAKIDEILGMDIKGLKVKLVLVEEKADIIKELYVGFVVDRTAKRNVLILSSEGGVNIEEVAQKSPDSVVKFEIDPAEGLPTHKITNLVKKIGLRGKEMVSVVGIINRLSNVFSDYDAELAEINPLVTTPEGLLAVDAKLIVDDNSLYRHKDLAKEFARSEEYTEIEKKAKDAGLSYVELDGDIGVIGCGAGLVMASLDTLQLYGGSAANFLDVGGGANAENMRRALELVVQKENVKSIFINIFGGITRCDEIAKGIVDFAPKTPISVRMMGTNEEEGKQILKDNGYSVSETIEESAKEAIELARGD
ncbi:MAG: ADP-forming succinate--CoA ligase subunit beta [Methanomassiliicoccales archaeon]|nr:MAG: ADP-forming succinate--CoA ligase subunit beta [Methanomassiliicoccales archaeon]